MLHLSITQEPIPNSLNQSKCNQQENVFRESERKLLQKNEICENSNSKRQDNSIKHKVGDFIPKENVRKLVNKFVSKLFHTTNVLPQRLKQFKQVDHYISQYNNSYFTNDDNNFYEKKWNIISLDNEYLLCWYLFRLLMHLASIFLISFQNYLSFNQLFIYGIFIIIFSALEILFNTHLSIFKNENYIIDRKDIIKSYLSKDFIIDSLSLFFWIIFLIADNHEKWYCFIEIIQLFLTTFKLIKCYYSINEQFQIQEIDRWEADLVQLIFTICITSYIIGCIWFYIGDKGQLYLENSWLYNLNIEGQNAFKLFNHSIYWALSTLITIGYGNIIPENWIETLYTNIIMVFSIIFYAYSLKRVGSIIKKFDKCNYQYNQKFLILKKFLIKNKIDNDLQLKALETLKEKINDKKKAKEQEQITQVMAMMPLKIKNLIDKQISENFINESTQLKQIFTPQTVKRIAQISQRVDLNEEEILFSSNNDLNLYIIQSGVIALYEQQSKKVFETLKANEKFGEKAFFTGFRQQYSAKSITNSIIHKIPRNLFMQIIQYSDQDFQKFHQIKDEIIYHKSYKECYSNCKICSEQKHLTFECPLLSYQHKQFVIKQNQENEREEFPLRSKWKKKNILKSYNWFQEQYYRFLNNHKIIKKQQTFEKEGHWSLQKNESDELNNAIDWEEEDYDDYDFYNHQSSNTIYYTDNVFLNEFDVAKEYEIYKPNGNKMDLINNAKKKMFEQQESTIYYG